MFKIFFVIALIATIFCLWIWLLLNSPSDKHFPDIKDL